MDSTEALSLAEITKLNTYLNGYHTPRDCMTFPVIDGFIAAINSGPYVPDPKIWIPTMLGLMPDEAWDFGRFSEARDNFDLLERHIFRACWYIRNLPERYQPMLYVFDDADNATLDIHGWCHGFMAGVGLDPIAWAPMFENEDDYSFIVCLQTYGTIRRWAGFFVSATSVL